MKTMTLRNRMLTTLTAGNNTLSTSAGRIGTRSMADVMPLAESPFQGSLSVPRLPSLKQVGLQQEVTTMRYEPNAVVPTGRVGSVSGNPARRARSHSYRSANWQRDDRHPASQACQSWSIRSISRLGSDCQSPDRLMRTADRNPNACSHTTSARTTSPATTAAK